MSLASTNIAPPPASPRHVSAFGVVLPIITAMLATILQTMRESLQLDKTLLLLIFGFAVVHGPHLTRATDNAVLLAAFSNDEPALTMALEAMTVRPYGNPANYFPQRDGRQRELPEHWHHVRYGTFVYYGGAYLDLALIFFAPLKLLGVPTFPAAPIILRCISLVCSLGAMILLYQFGKRYASQGAATCGALIMLTDPCFAYYSMTIHPDSLQLCLCYLALFVAVKHAEFGDLASLGAIGIIAGLVQGTKIGGPWLVPMTLLSMFWGLRAHSLNTNGHVWREIPCRLALVGGAALSAFFMTTPYAFLDSYYLFSLKTAYVGFAEQPFGHIDILSWLTAIVDHLGILLVTGIGAGMIGVLFGAFRNGANKVLFLALVLSLSNFFWYACAGKLWVVVGYLLPALGLLSILAFDVLFHASNALRKRFTSATWLPPLLCASVLGLVFLPRLLATTELVLIGCTAMDNTSMELDRWAKAHWSSESRILFDDSAYFDPNVFPHATRWGGVLKYSELAAHKPQYLVLSSSLHDAPWYKELRRTQDLARHDVSPYSMRLYQDLLDRNPHSLERGPTGVPGIELVAVIAPTRINASDNASFIGKPIQRVERVAQLIDGLLGPESSRHGHTLMVYRLTPEAWTLAAP